MHAAARRGPAVAVALLLVSGAMNYGYEVFPLALQADAQNAIRACVLALLAVIPLALWPCWSVLLAWVVWTLEQLLVAGCSVAYILRGSPATDSGNQCTGLLHYDFNGLGVALLVAAMIYALRQDMKR